MFPITQSLVAGIDVGGPAKGFHAVALQDRRLVAKHASRSASEIAAWCVKLDASVIAIDAPCHWRSDGGPARAAEVQLARAGISSYSTPTEEKGSGHAFYTWMLAGMELFSALAPSHSLYDGTSPPARVCIETFPQAVACALAGKIVSAKAKAVVRRALLEEGGLRASSFSNIDEVDAALCAIAADRFARGDFRAFGDKVCGFIVVPSGPILAAEPRQKATPNRNNLIDEILPRLGHLNHAELLMLRSRLEEMLDA